MIDNLFKFNTETDAISDEVVGDFYKDSWRGDVCISGVSITQIVGDTRIPWPYWYLIVATNDDSLSSHPNCIVSIDWDTNTVIKSLLPEGMTFQDFEISPYFMGRDPTKVGA